MQNPRWPHPIVLVIFLLFVPSQLYIAYFTSDVLAPLQPARIRTNQELLDQGFRVVCEHTAYAPVELQNFTRGGVSFDTNNSFFEPDTPAACKTWTGASASQMGGRRHAEDADEIRVCSPFVRFEPAMTILYCSTLEELWDRSVWLTLQFMGRLQTKINDCVSPSIEAGIFPGF